MGGGSAAGVNQQDNFALASFEISIEIPPRQLNIDVLPPKITERSCHS
jgi:hypothetical protein